MKMLVPKPGNSCTINTGFRSWTGDNAEFD